MEFRCLLLCMAGTAATAAGTAAGILTYWADVGYPRLSQVPWHRVTNREELKIALTSPGIISVRVDNGTEWLQLGGDLNTFLPIVVSGQESSGTSDLSLDHLMQQLLPLLTKGVKIGLHVRVESPGVLGPSMDVLSARLGGGPPPCPLLVEAALLLATPPLSSRPLIQHTAFREEVSKVPGVIPVLSWATYHGMDKVWNRIKEDNILRSFQSSRVLQMAEDLFLGPDRIRNPDVRFLELLLKKLEKSNPASFTVLALSQLLATIEANGLHKLDSAANDPWAPRLASKPPRANPVREILPEYYITSSNYTAEDVEAMLQLAAMWPPGTPLGFMLRAGLLHTPDSVSAVAKLLSSGGAKEAPADRFLIVGAESTDREDHSSADKLANRVGLDRVLMALPDARKAISGSAATSEEGGAIRVPQPREDAGGGASSWTSTFLLVFLSFVGHLVVVD